MKFRISKLGVNELNPFGFMSEFGDSKPYFEGHADHLPKVGERFILRDLTGTVVINTSYVTGLDKGKFYTFYSVYSIEEIYENK